MGRLADGKPFPRFSLIAADSRAAGADFAAVGEAEGPFPRFVEYRPEFPVEPAFAAIPRFFFDDDQMIPVFHNFDIACRQIFIDFHDVSMLYNVGVLGMFHAACRGILCRQRHD